MDANPGKGSVKINMPALDEKKVSAKQWLEGTQNVWEIKENSGDEKTKVTKRKKRKEKRNEATEKW